VTWRAIRIERIKNLWTW